MTRVLAYRVLQLEASGTGNLLGAAEQHVAVQRYTDAFRCSGPAFPNAITPDQYSAAITFTRNTAHQRLLACWLPGDEDL